MKAQLDERNGTTLGHTFFGRRWVTEAQYSDIYSISRQTLANWRFHDSRAGRTEARPGYPTYRRFGRAIRYLLESEDFGGRAA